MVAIIVIIVFLLCCSAFFAGAETALTAASRPRMHALAQQDNRRARIVNELRTRMEQVIAALLLGNNLVNITASALATSVMIAIQRWLCSVFWRFQPIRLKAGINASGSVTHTAVTVRIPAKR